MERQNSGLKNQTYKQYFDIFYLDYNSTSYVNRICNACLYYKNRSWSVFLISDDIYLRNKTLASNIDTLLSKDLLEIVQNISICQHTIGIDVPLKKSS